MTDTINDPGRLVCTTKGELDKLNDGANEMLHALYSARYVFQAMANADTLQEAEFSAIAELSGFAMEHIAQRYGEDVTGIAGQLRRDTEAADNKNAETRRQKREERALPSTSARLPCCTSPSRSSTYPKSITAPPWSISRA